MHSLSLLLQSILMFCKGWQEILTDLGSTDASNYPAVSRLDCSKAMQILHDDNNKRALFGDHDWVVYNVNWLPLHITDDNLQHIVDQSVVLASFTADKVIQAISFNCLTKLADGERLDVWYYGHNVPMLIAHVLKSLQCLSAEEPSSKFYVLVHFPEQLDFDRAYQELLPVLGERYQVPPFNVDKLQAAVFYWEPRYAQKSQ